MEKSAGATTKAKKRMPPIHATRDKSMRKRANMR
jgi:hypothetical protein